MNKIYITELAAAARLNVTPRTLQRWRGTGDGPEYVRIGPRCVRYSLEAIEAWEASRTYAHRAAELARTTPPGGRSLND